LVHAAFVLPAKREAIAKWHIILVTMFKIRNANGEPPRK